MYFKYFLFVVIIITINISCKTTEQLQREKLLDSLSLKMVHVQKENSNSNIKIQEIQKRLSGLTGEVEEKYHTQKTNDLKEIQKIKEDIDVIKSSLNNALVSLKDQEQQLDDQKKYINQILSTLKKISGGAKSSKKKLSPYKSAMADYRKGRYKTARKKLNKLNTKKMSSGQKARIFHNLGMCNFILKNYDNSIIYFSKLITQYPKSGHIANALLFLGKSLTKKGQKEDAKDAYGTLIENHPKAKQTKQAKKLLKSLK